MSDATELDDLTDSGEDSNGPKALREALKAAKAKNAEYETELSELRAFRQSLVKKEIFESLGVPAKAAKLYSGEASEDAIKEWLGEVGDLIGYAPADEQDEGQVQAARIAAAAERGTPTTPSVNPTPEELRSLPFTEIAKKYGWSI